MKNNIRNERPEIREYHSDSTGVFFQISRLLLREVSRFQRIEVFENPFFGKVLVLDGLIQTTERDEFFYHEMLVHPALNSHPSPKDVLIIGGGDGGTLREVLRYPVEQATLVEIDSKVIDVCREAFPWLNPALEDERSRLVIDDGTKFVQETADKFDVILVDSSEPIGPSTPLHSEEFYLNLKEKLNTDGIVAGQIGSPLFHMEAIKREYGFLRKIFKYVALYTGPVPTYPGGTWCYAFLSDWTLPGGTEHPLPPDLTFFNQEMWKSVFSLPEFMKSKLD
ncbi:polyamine aminopropyltransferase [Acidobacteriota bacterium]